MAIDLQTAHRDLWKWCRSRKFAGYDPYDGLNSSLFQATPLRNSRPARLAWIQFFKRSPINFRSLAGIQPEQNPKGIALFALAALADYRRTRTKEAEIDARELIDDLIETSLKGFKGAAWGYNFDWQSRAFFAPKGTPAIVPTAFAVRALCEAAEVIDRDEYLPFARTACDFILNDLHRSDETPEEFCFSYSPLDRTRVFNASLLAAETLASVGGLFGEASLCDMAMRAARYVIRRQRQDGSWAYGTDDYQAWCDNFHTAFILTSLSRIMRALGEGDFRDETHHSLSASGDGLSKAWTLELEPALSRGYEFWQERFFLSNGWPKYYPDRLYPVDIHSAASAIVTLVELRGRIPNTLLLAEKIAEWVMKNMRDEEGFYYYQRRRFHTVRIPYMRWSEGWMMYALARLREAMRSVPGAVATGSGS
jgi:hypothetical protein